MNTLRMTRFLLAVMTLMLVLGLFPPVARAAPLLPSNLTPPIPDNAVGVHCSTSGNGTICHWTDTYGTPPGGVPYGTVACNGAPVIVSLQGERHFTAAYDESGQAVWLRRHIAFSGTLSSPTTGRSVPHEGHATITVDYQNNTNTTSGLLHYTVLPGEGIVFLDAGIIVITDGSISFVGGPHQFFDLATQQLCAALA